MKRYWLVLAAILVGMSFLDPARAQESKPGAQEKSALWMKKKLQLTQNILAGLTEADFEKIHKNADELNFLGYVEKWLRADMPEYKRQMSQFELANLELIRQAKRKNLEGATLAYNQLTVSCVQCHKVIRDAKK